MASPLLKNLKQQRGSPSKRGLPRARIPEANLSLTERVNDIKPFIVDESTGTVIDSLDGQALSSTVPINAEILRIAERYRDRDLPKRLREPLNKTREFFLSELTPMMLGVANGMLEATDVLRETFQEEPSIGAYVRKMEALAQRAVEIKMLSFVMRTFCLTKDEAQVFIASHLAKEIPHSDLVQQIAAMLQTANAQREVVSVPRALPAPPVNNKKNMRKKKVRVIKKNPIMGDS